VPIALGGVAAVLLLGAGGYLAHRRRSTATNASANS
jgi:MYXO-CTERM domain-containing protein